MNANYRTAFSHIMTRVAAKISPKSRHGSQRALSLLAKWLRNYDDAFGKLIMPTPKDTHTKRAQRPPTPDKKNVKAKQPKKQGKSNWIKGYLMITFF